jgi:hypothetical protein
MRKAIALIVLLCPSLGFAQNQHLEITPTFSFRNGGSIVIEERAFQHQDFSLDITTDNTLGIRLAIPVSQRLAVELMANRQSSELEDRHGLFGEQPGGFFPIGVSNLTDIEVTYYHAGLILDLGKAATRGYLVASGGVTRIDPKNLPLKSDSPLSASIGAGVQFDFSRHLGMIIEGRFYWSDTDSSISATEQYEHRDCTAPCTYTYRYESGMTQTELIFGLVIKP